MEEVLTVKETAALLRCHPSTLYSSIKEKTCPPYFKIGSDYRFIKTEVVRWMKEQGHERA